MNFFLEIMELGTGLQPCTVIMVICPITSIRHSTFFLQTKEMGTVPDQNLVFLKHGNGYRIRTISIAARLKWVPDQNHKHCGDTEMGTGSEPLSIVARLKGYGNHPPCICFCYNKANADDGGWTWWSTFTPFSIVVALSIASTSLSERIIKQQLQQWQCLWALETCLAT